MPCASTGCALQINARFPLSFFAYLAAPHASTVQRRIKLCTAARRGRGYQPANQSVGDSWAIRARALRNVPVVLQLAWESGPGVVAAGVACRIAGALLPVMMLGVAKSILDAVQRRSTTGELRPDFWWLVALECGLAVFGAVLGRVGWFFDSLLSDRFTRHVSVRVMAHASRLDLSTYEDPAFHNTLERARVQATDRVSMIHALGSLLQQGVTVVTLSASIAYFSPWLLALLVLAVVPAFVGESHFAFLGYSLNIEQTPARRRLDYLRQLGSSKEAAKELKLFGLAPFITGEYAQLADQLCQQNVRLARRRLLSGVLSVAHQHGQLLRRVRVRRLQDGQRRR